MATRPGLGKLLLLGAAAFGAYKYSKMTEQQKSDLKNKGKKFVDENLGSLKNVFGGQRGDSANSRGDGNFGQSGPQF